MCDTGGLLLNFGELSTMSNLLKSHTPVDTVMLHGQA